jgi:DNA replication protein DnaC
MSLTNSQYESIMRIYNRRQLKAERDLEERRRLAYARIPRLAGIDADIASVSVKKAKALLTGDTKSDFDVKESIRALAEERVSLLQAGGYPENYLEPVYHCPLCHDTGYVNNEKCSCFRQLEINLLYSKSNLNDILDKENFEDFSLAYYSENVINPLSGLSERQEAKDALDNCRQFTAEFPIKIRQKSGVNLCLYGDVGTGKTFLTHCIARELISSGFSVLYMTAYDLFDLLGKRKFRSTEEAQEAGSSVFSCDLLIIDDLGTELFNNFVTSELFLVVNERALSGRSTVISTNLSLEKFRDAFSERTFSRIMGSYQLIHLSGKDIRIQKKLSGGN